MESTTTTKTHIHDTLLISKPIYSFYSTSFYNNNNNGRFEEQQPHFLDSCFLCKKSLSSSKDIFMYRGDTPFCSEDCREEQIVIDEAKEEKQRLFASIKAMKKKEKEKRKKSKSSIKSPNYPFHFWEVAAT